MLWPLFKDHQPPARLHLTTANPVRRGRAQPGRRQACGRPPTAALRAQPATPVSPYDRQVDSEVHLTHVDQHGVARMVDITAKPPAAREAVASGVFRTTEEVVGLLRADQLPKGDALAVARIAGIMAAKRTPDLIPLCHPIALTDVAVELHPVGREIRITATVRTTDRTGVEMEALTAVAVAGLTLHDMVKAVDPAAVLDTIQVERKVGGKTGLWTRPQSTPAHRTGKTDDR